MSLTTTLEWADPGKPLPTKPGKTVGVIATWPNHHRSHPGATTQCSVCFRTATGETQWAVNAIDFRGDTANGWASSLGRATGTALPYRRCDDCRSQHKHPTVKDN